SPCTLGLAANPKGPKAGRSGTIAVTSRCFVLIAVRGPGPVGLSSDSPQQCRSNAGSPTNPQAADARPGRARTSMTAILGISAFYHDSAAALVVDGEIVAAAQEERFTRKKHDYNFPQNAIDYCLAQGGLKPEELDYVAFYDKPLTKFERLLETYLAFAPAGF